MHLAQGGSDCADELGFTQIVLLIPSPSTNLVTITCGSSSINTHLGATPTFGRELVRLAFRVPVDAQQVGVLARDANDEVVIAERTL